MGQKYGWCSLAATPNINIVDCIATAESDKVWGQHLFKIHLLTAHVVSVLNSQPSSYIKTTRGLFFTTFQSEYSPHTPVLGDTSNINPVSDFYHLMASILAELALVSFKRKSSMHMQPRAMQLYLQQVKMWLKMCR